MTDKGSPRRVNESNGGKKHRELPSEIVVTSTFLLSPHWYDILEDDRLEAELNERFEQLLLELHGYVLDVAPLTDPSMPGRLEFEIGEMNSEDRQCVIDNSPLRMVFDEYFPLRVKSIWSDPEYIAEINRAQRVRDDEEVIARCGANICNSLVCHILLLMNIYLPGSSRCHYVYSSTDAGLGSLGCVSSFQETYSLLAKRGISPTPEFSFLQLLEWSKNVDGFWKGKPNTNVGRALNFLSHTHHRTHQLNTLADIAWIVGALEAILTESNQEIRAKMSRRALAMCPELTALVSARDLGRLYDFRSKFLHGGIEIPNHFNDEMDDDWYGFEFTNAFDLASAVLFKCLQRIAGEGWTSVRFTEEVTGS